MKKHIFIMASAALALASCQSSEKGASHVSGVLSGAGQQMVYLDQKGLMPTVTVDSVKLGTDGSFRLSGSVQSEPAFYEVRLADGRAFAVLLDSAQDLHLSADASGKLLVGNVQFEQSPRNENLQKVQVGASALLEGISNSRNVDSLRNAVKDYKEQIRQLVYADPQSMVGYYAVLQTVGGSRLYDVMNKQDHQLFSTVATSLSIAYPGSEQVKYLCDLTLAARAQQRMNAKRDSLISGAKVVETPELVMPDLAGNQHRLTESFGKVTILSFWLSSDQASRAANRHLAKLQKTYGDKGLRIFSVCFDTNKLFWEAASKQDAITWTDVCDLQGASSQAALLYNVRNVPANYIIDGQGRLIGKDLFGSRLDEKLQSLF